MLSKQMYWQWRDWDERETRISCVWARAGGRENILDRVQNGGIKHTQCGHMTDHWHFGSYSPWRACKYSNTYTQTRTAKIWIKFEFRIKENVLIASKFIFIWPVCCSIKKWAMFATNLHFHCIVVILFLLLLLLLNKCSCKQGALLPRHLNLALSKTVSLKPAHTYTEKCGMNDLHVDWKGTIEWRGYTAYFRSTHSQLLIYKLLFDLNLFFCACAGEAFGNIKAYCKWNTFSLRCIDSLWRWRWRWRWPWQRKV